jgi:hypothetical protein
MRYFKEVFNFNNIKKCTLYEVMIKDNIILLKYNEFNLEITILENMIKKQRLLFTVNESKDIQTLKDLFKSDNFNEALKKLKINNINISNQIIEHNNIKIGKMKNLNKNKIYKRKHATLSKQHKDKNKDMNFTQRLDKKNIFPNKIENLTLPKENNYQNSNTNRMYNRRMMSAHKNNRYISNENQFENINNKDRTITNMVPIKSNNLERTDYSLINQNNTSTKNDLNLFNNFPINDKKRIPFRSNENENDKNKLKDN